MVFGGARGEAGRSAGRQGKKRRGFCNAGEVGQVPLPAAVAKSSRRAGESLAKAGRFFVVFSGGAGRGARGKAKRTRKLDFKPMDELGRRWRSGRARWAARGCEEKYEVGGFLEAGLSRGKARRKRARVGKRGFIERGGRLGGPVAIAEALACDESRV